MDTNKMREQFEAAAKNQGLSLARTHQALRFANGTSRAAADYVALETLCAWWAWQASREAVVVELPSEDTCRTSTSKEEAVQEAYNHALGECRAAIEAQGLKVEP